MESYQIKEMEGEAEISGKGYVHYKSWHETYAGLIDEEYLQGVTLESCIAMAHRWTGNILVAKEEEKVIGFAAYGPCRDKDLPEYGEVYAIYVLQAHHDRGIGYGLMNAAFGKLSKYPKIAVWVLRGNERAIRFYKRYGFCMDGSEKEVVLGTPKTELRMIFERKQDRPSF